MEASQAENDDTQFFTVKSLKIEEDKEQVAVAQEMLKSNKK